MVMTAVATFFQSKLEARYGAEAVRLVRRPGLVQRAFLKRTTPQPVTGVAAAMLSEDDSVKAGKELS